MTKGLVVLWLWTLYSMTWSDELSEMLSATWKRPKPSHWGQFKRTMEIWARRHLLNHLICPSTSSVHLFAAYPLNCFEHYPSLSSHSFFSPEIWLVFLVHSFFSSFKKGMWPLLKFFQFFYILTLLMETLICYYGRD